MYSVMTDYEGGLLHFIPFSGHRFFDLAVALILGGSAWHFSMGGRPRDAGTVAQ